MSVTGGHQRQSMWLTGRLRGQQKHSSSAGRHRQEVTSAASSLAGKKRMCKSGGLLPSIATATSPRAELHSHAAERGRRFVEAAGAQALVESVGPRHPRVQPKGTSSGQGVRVLRAHCQHHLPGLSHNSPDFSILHGGSHEWRRCQDLEPEAHAAGKPRVPCWECGSGSGQESAIQRLRRVRP